MKAKQNGSVGPSSKARKAHQQAAQADRPVSLAILSVKGLVIPTLPVRKKTTRIVVHCSATYPEQDIDATDIDEWHQMRGWKCIGYHLVIKRDGTIEAGRTLGVVGAHAKGYNHTSVSVCLIGGLRSHHGGTDTNFTMRQWLALEKTLTYLKTRYPDAKVVGHRDLDAKKACPTFNAQVLM